MKVRTALQAAVGLLAVSWVAAQAPYAPSGYRPPGRQFALPARPTNNQGFGSGIQPQNQYVPPTNQYGAPPPPSQYAPGLQSTDFRFNVGQTNRQAGQGGQQQYDFSGQGGQQQYDFPGQNQQQDSSNQQFGFGGQQVPQQQYGAPNQIQGNQNRQLNQNGQLGPNRQQYLQQQQSYPTQNKNVEQKSFIGQGFSDQNQGFGIANVNNRQRPLPRTSVSERNYLAPNREQQNQPEQSRNFGKKQTARQQLYQTPNSQRDEEAANNNNDQAFSGNDDQNLNVANQNYLPPTTTERRRYPEPTTRRPVSREAADPEDDESQDPNVAVATAVARGQYYLWQPDGRLQRVQYKTTQTEEDLKNNAVSAKLVYQAVQPITAPIYTYPAPLVGL